MRNLLGKVLGCILILVFCSMCVYADNTMKTGVKSCSCTLTKTKPLRKIRPIILQCSHREKSDTVIIVNNVAPQSTLTSIPDDCCNKTIKEGNGPAYVKTNESIDTASNISSEVIAVPTPVSNANMQVFDGLSPAEIALVQYYERTTTGKILQSSETLAGKLLDLPYPTITDLTTTDATIDLDTVRAQFIFLKERNYLSKKISDASTSTLLPSSLNNPHYDSNTILYKNKEVSSSNIPLVPNIGGVALPSFTAINPEAVTEFLVSRAKSEVFSWVLHNTAQIFEKLDTNIHQLLPNTQEILSKHKNVSGFRIGNEFTQAVKSDVDQLPRNILRNNNIITKPEIKNFGLLIYGIVEGKSFPDVIENLSVELVDDTSKIAKTIKILHAVSKQIRINTVAESYYPSVQLLQILLPNAKLKGALRTNLSTVNSSLQILKIENRQYNAKIEKLAGLLKKIEVRYDDCRRFVNNPSLYQAAYSSYLESIAEIIVTVLSDEDFISSEEKLTRLNIRKVHQMINVYKALAENNSALALQSAVQLIEIPGNAFSNRILRVTELVANLSTAKNKEDVGKILDDYSDMPNSSAYRSNLHSWISVNASLGLFGGVNFNKTSSPRVSPFLPLGLDLSRRICDWPPSFGLLVSLVDLGALADKNLNGNNDSTSVDNKISWEQVISPGLYLKTNLGFNGPFVFGAGANIIPGGQRNLKNNSPVALVRLGIFAAVELPLLTLSYTEKTN